MISQKLTSQIKYQKKQLDEYINTFKLSSRDMPNITILRDLYNYLWTKESYLGEEPPVSFIYNGALIKPKEI